MCYLAAQSPHQIDVEFLTKGLHDLGGVPMARRIQESIDRADPMVYEVVMLGYALCGNGLIGLEARKTPLVVPRAHDCIALLMGSRERYQEYFDANAGVYFRSPGWLERGENLEQLSMEQSKKKSVAGNSLEELVAKYGEDNGRYLWEQFTSYQQTYRQITYIETGVERNGQFVQQARDEAVNRGWAFDHVKGDLELLERFMSGQWNDRDFLKVPVGYRIIPTYDETIVSVERIAS
jgi:hypothetical protein